MLSNVISEISWALPVTLIPGYTGVVGGALHKWRTEKPHGYERESVAAAL